MLAEITPEQLRRRARFEGYGPLTFKSLIHYLCSHDQQHLAGLQWVLGQYDAAQGAAGRTQYKVKGRPIAAGARQGKVVSRVKQERVI